MIRKTLIPVLFAAALLLWGCPYESEVPIDEPCIKVNKNWYGLWKKPGEEKSYASLSKYNRTDSLNYRVVYNSWTSEHGSYDVKMFRAFLSKIDETYFINIQPEMKMGGDYYLFGIQWNKTQDSLCLRPVNEENAPKFTDSKSLHNWIAKGMNKKDFFDPEEVFVKVAQPE